MTHRGYRNVGGETRLDDLRTYQRSPNSSVEHKGRCGCGAETSRYVTVGAPGHPENGWECANCGNLRLQFEMQKHDPRR